MLTRENIEAVIKFAHKEKLFIFADEVRFKRIVGSLSPITQVYQHNVYAEGSQFHSFKKVKKAPGLS